MEKYIKAPLEKEIVKTLRAGDYVYITGTIYTARDAAHKRMDETLREGKELRFRSKMRLSIIWDRRRREMDG